MVLNGDSRGVEGGELIIYNCLMNLAATFLDLASIRRQLLQSQTDF